MSNNNTNPTDLKNLLSRFFEKDFEITERILIISEKFLFNGVNDPEIRNNEVLQSTLVYIKNVMDRNELRNLADLTKYYEKKRNNLHTLFDRLEETDPEECFALDFQRACTMYMKTITVEQIDKTGCLYYLQSSEKFHGVEFHFANHYAPLLSVPMPASWEDVKKFMSEVKGTLLVAQEKKCHVSEERMNELMCN